MAARYDRLPEVNSALRVGLAQGTADQAQTQLGETAALVGQIAGQLAEVSEAADEAVARSASARSAAQQALEAAQQGGGGVDIADDQAFLRAQFPGSVLGADSLLRSFYYPGIAAEALVTLADGDQVAADIGTDSAALPRLASVADPSFAGATAVAAGFAPTNEGQVGGAALVSFSRDGADLRVADVVRETGDGELLETVRTVALPGLPLAYPTAGAALQIGQYEGCAVFAPWDAQAAIEVRMSGFNDAGFSASAQPSPIPLPPPFEEPSGQLRMSQAVLFGPPLTVLEGPPRFLLFAWPRDDNLYGTVFEYDPYLQAMSQIEGGRLDIYGAAGEIVQTRLFQGVTAALPFRMVNTLGSGAELAEADLPDPEAIPLIYDMSQPFEQPFFAAAYMSMEGERPSRAILVPSAERHVYLVALRSQLPLGSEDRFVVERHPIPGSLIPPDRRHKFAFAAYSGQRLSTFCIPLVGPILEVSGGLGTGRPFECSVFAEIPGDQGFATAAAACHFSELFILQRNPAGDTRFIVKQAPRLDGGGY
jgi:hypothetical protein